MSNQQTTSRVAEGGSGWSPERMMARLGGDEALTRQLVSLFLTECPRMMAEVRASVAQGSAEVVRRAAHAFKGSVSNFTDRGAAVTARELEDIGREGASSAHRRLLAGSSVKWPCSWIGYASSTPNTKNTVVHASRFSLLGSCLGFGVRAVRYNGCHAVSRTVRGPDARGADAVWRRGAPHRGGVDQAVRRTAPR